MAKNEMIKKAYSESEYTPQDIMELKKCINDPIYFMTNYIKVIHPTQGVVPFNLYDYQLRMVDAVHNNKDVIILASRQLGKCFFRTTKLLNTIKKPEGFRKFLLYFVERKTYDRIFSNSNS